MILTTALLLSGMQPLSAMAYWVEKAKTSSNHEVNVIRMEGAIQVNEVLGWMANLRRIDPELDTLVIVTSPGGAFPGGTMLMNRAEEFISAQRERGRKVSVLATRDCSSMCIPFFYLFDSRLSFGDTRFGFHGISAGGIAFNPEETALYLKRMEEKAKDRHDSLFPNWIGRKKSEGVFSGTSLTPLSARQLAEENSGVVATQDLVEDERRAIDRLDSGN